jgi:hypothetical protein
VIRLENLPKLNGIFDLKTLRENPRKGGQKGNEGSLTLTGREIEEEKRKQQHLRPI